MQLNTRLTGRHHGDAEEASPLQRFVGRSSFRVSDNVLIAACVRSAETLSVSATREPFECFMATFRIRVLVEHCGGAWPRDAPSFVVAFLRSFDESIDGTDNLVRVRSESGNALQPREHLLGVRVTVLWTPRLATSCLSNATAFDMSLARVESHARDSFAWTLVNDMHGAVTGLTKALNRVNSRATMSAPTC